MCTDMYVLGRAEMCLWCVTAEGGPEKWQMIMQPLHALLDEYGLNHSLPTLFK